MKKLICLPFFLLFIFSCQKKTEEVTFDVAKEWENIEKAYNEVQSLRKEMDDIKEKIKILEDAKANPKKYKKEELPQESIEVLKQKLDELRKTKYDPVYNAFLDNLSTIFLTKVLNDEKLRDLPETKKAIRLYSDECIISGDEYITEGGKYKEAINIYKQAYELDPNYEKLKEKIKEAEEFMYITKERFDKVKNGMTMDEVKSICGYPNISYIQEKEEKGKKIIGWYYPKGEGQKAAGIYFYNGKVYSKSWD